MLCTWFKMGLLKGGRKPGILRDFFEHGKLGEFCATTTTPQPFYGPFPGPPG